MVYSRPQTIAINQQNQHIRMEIFIGVRAAQKVLPQRHASVMPEHQHSRRSISCRPQRRQRLPMNQPCRWKQHAGAAAMCGANAQQVKPTPTPACPWQRGGSGGHITVPRHMGQKEMAPRKLCPPMGGQGNCCVSGKIVLKR